MTSPVVVNPTARHTASVDIKVLGHTNYTTCDVIYSTSTDYNNFTKHTICPLMTDDKYAIKFVQAWSHGKYNKLCLLSLIFLHGLGDTGHGWSAGFEHIQEPYVKYICPNAPVMPVTLNGGFRMPSWFDLHSLNPQGQEDEKGIKKASENLKALITEEAKHVPTNRIVIGGFSQGGSVALYTALTMDKPLAGVLALSTWLPLHKSFPAALKWNSSTPVLQCHGEADHMVAIGFGRLTSQVIKSFPAPNHEFKTYPGLAHSSSEEEMKDVQRWLKKVLPPTD